VTLSLSAVAAEADTIDAVRARYGH